MVKRSGTKAKAFTLIETVFATVLFGILVVVTLGIIRYTGQTSAENKDASTIANELQNNRTVLKTIAAQQGWETFLNTHTTVDPGTGALGPRTHSFLNAAYQPTQDPPGNITEGEWRVTLSVDTDAGPYLQRIEKDTAPPLQPKYILRFSSPVYGKAKGLNDLVPVINASARWTIEPVDPLSFSDGPGTASATLTIGTVSFSPGNGYRIRPTENVVDGQERADVSYAKGVPLPDTGAVTGYPGMIKLRFQTLRSGSNLYFNDVLNAEEAL